VYKKKTLRKIKRGKGRERGKKKADRIRTIKTCRAFGLR